MKFINPKVDYAFKKIFGSEQSQQILISFLNAIIYDGEKTIKSLTIINPFNPGQVISLKDTYLDIKAVFFDGSVVVIEMQVARMTALSKRVMYNLVKGYGNQLETGDDYPLLRPAIAVTITDFIFFKEEVDVINPFVFKHRDKNWEYPDQELQLIFVELPKFKKTLAELKTLADKWIYFLKEAAKFDDIPESLGEVAEIEQALNIAERINMSPEELEIVERRAIALQDEKGRLTYAEEQGEAKGRLNEAIALVKLLITQRFGEVSETINSQIEGLPLEDVEDLVKVFLSFNSLVDLESWLEERLI
ncbi:Rpn family recombination-promoting nuclease/putative transposase [Dapis sp. BLCC M229]|uniref:Rpn family recombination-promoting nuclease/putative transposase n=1 Tax=Dapis sp. BLCC M229 TaxID=3400188 RepID=UPI003CF946B8